ncbi:IS66 family transposase [Candidatus Uhrbacteria bacterium]|nr:IS66 family transposase [Candidatus Uhrbacteria bacterium]
MDQTTKPQQGTITEEEWAQTPAAVQELVLSLIVRVQELEAEVAKLREQVNRNSHNSSNPPSSDGPEVPPKSRKRPGGKRNRGAQPGHEGKKRKLVPPEEVKESHEIKPEACRQCGHNLQGEDAEPYRHQVTEIPPVVAEVVEYRLHTLTCPECGGETRAELPEGVPQGAFGPRLQAMVSLLTGRYRMSKRDAAEIMDDFFQADPSVGSVCALEKRTSEAIKEPVEEALAYVKEQPSVHMDETGWYEANQKAWLWVAATSQVTTFLIRRSRGGKVAREMLGEEFQGIASSDRWSAYNWLPVSSRQLCWSHLIRDFQAFAERGGGSQYIGEALLFKSDLMFQWWHRVRAGTMSRSDFQLKMQPLQQSAGQLLREGTTCGHKKTAGTCRNILKREAALWTFVRLQGVKPTNNLAERQVRHGVRWRKTSFGTQSETGSRFAERIMTVVATMKQQQRNLLDYLTEACEAANWNKPSPSLLPLTPIP